MKFSPVEDYSLRCLTLLARHAPHRLTIGRIAESEGLSDENTAKIMARLRDAGLVDSHRGKDGGYTLPRPAHAISVADVLDGIGGEFFEQEHCRGDETTAACVHQLDCGIRSVWTTLGELIRQFLRQVTLADLSQDELAVRQALGRNLESMDVSRFHPAARLPARSGELA